MFTLVIEERQTVPDAGEWLTTKEAAAYLKVSVRTILRRVADGTLPATRVGPKLLRFRRGDLDRVFAPTRSPSSRQPPSATPPRPRRPSRSK